MSKLFLLGIVILKFITGSFSTNAMKVHMELEHKRSLTKMNSIIYTGGVGLFIVLVSQYIGWSVYPFLVSREIKSRIILKNGTIAVKHLYVPQKWEFNVYVFNITNPQEIIQGDIPVVKELGPYIYDQYKSKVDIDLTKNDTVSYKIENKFYFNGIKSGSYKESDIITTINIPLLVTAYVFEDIFPEGLILLNSVVPDLLPEKQDLFIQVSAGDLFFNGITVSCSYRKGPAKNLCEELRKNRHLSYTEVPESEDLSFSYFYKLNSTPSGTYTINRGTKNVYELGNIVEYDNLPYLDMWNRNSSCSELRGSDWTIFPPVFGTRDIYLYMPETCLSMNAFYNTYKDIYGLKVHGYIVKETNFMSPNFIPKNICLCKRDKKNVTAPPKCPKNGVIDVSKCQGEPFFYSFPHTWYSDYENDVIGYTEDMSRDMDSEIFVESQSGVPIYICKKIQKNLLLRKLEELNILANVTERMVPIVWTDEKLSEEQTQINLNQFSRLIMFNTVRMSICGLLIGFGVFLLLSAYFMYSKFTKHNEDQSFNSFFELETRTCFDGYY